MSYRRLGEHPPAGRSGCRPARYRLPVRAVNSGEPAASAIGAQTHLCILRHRPSEPVSEGMAGQGEASDLRGAHIGRRPICRSSGTAAPASTSSEAGHVSGTMHIAMHKGSARRQQIE